MKNTLKIASRNIFRNVRRSVMTISAITVGATALLLFGEFFENIKVGLETAAVMQTGHISVFKKGYFDFGSGNPGAYGIDNYEEVMEKMRSDAIMKPMINVLTPAIRLYGVAGNSAAETSKTFMAAGVVAEDYNRMRVWDEHGLRWAAKYVQPVLTNSDETHGIIGIGLSKILGLCEVLKVGDCPKLESKPPATEPKRRDFGDLGQEEIKASSQSEENLARLDLLSATATGAPNVVSFVVDKAVTQGVKELDDSFIAMHFSLAQKLLYGREKKSSNVIVLQLNHTADQDKARKRLEDMFKENNWNLEVRDLDEMQPFYKQAVGMFNSIFSFIAVIMAVIALFTVVNTMSMSVMERTNEIGTIRALGVKKAGIIKQFVVEGSLLGLIGSSIGIFVGSIVAAIINHSGLLWLPPGQAEPIPLKVQNHDVGMMLFAIWLGLIMMAVIAAYFPAQRASKMKIVDALGHI